jgi:ADP-ribose pyrophosphatase
MPKITDRHVAFATPWFDVVAKHVDSQTLPYYAVTPLDYVTVLARDIEGRMLLVRQYRPVVEDYTIELPSGLVDAGETPEEAIRRELVEETGHMAGEIELLGSLLPDVGRLGNRMWCFVANDVRPIVPEPLLDDGIELIKRTPEEFTAALEDLSCCHALNFAAILLAMLKGKFAAPNVS